MMSWILTAITLIGFGFTIVQFFEQLAQIHGIEPPSRPLSPSHFALALIGAGVVALVVSGWQYRAVLRYLRQATSPRSPDSVKSRRTRRCTGSPSSRSSSAYSRFSPSRRGRRENNPACQASLFSEHVHGLEPLLAQYWWVLFVRGALAVAFGLTTLVWPDLSFAVLLLFVSDLVPASTGRSRWFRLSRPRSAGPTFSTAL